MHCSKCVSFWGTSYSRPPIDPYLTPPCYSLPPVTKFWRRHWIKVGAIDAAAHSGNRPTDKKRESPLYFGCDFYGWCNCGKIIKIVATRCPILQLKCTNDITVRTYMIRVLPTRWLRKPAGIEITSLAPYECGLSPAQNC